MEPHVEWDEGKNLSNQRKHGISFEQAVHVFDDPLSISSKERFTDDEERWQTLGSIDGVVLLLVAHTVAIEADKGEVLRIISARRASPRERRFYEDQSDAPRA